MFAPRGKQPHERASFAGWRRSLCAAKRPAPTGRQTPAARRGQDPSLRFAVHGCHVGSGLDRSGNLPSGSPFPGVAHVRPAGVRKNGCSRSRPRSGHARPLPIQGTAFRVDEEHRPLYRRGGFHIRPWEYAAAQTPRRGQDPSLRFAVHGCHVGSGLDRSGNLPSGSPFPGAAHVRPAGVRKTGARGPGRCPGNARPLPLHCTEQR